MASTVAKACSSSSQLSPVTTFEVKGSRNKRKFRADPPLTDPHKIITEPQNECKSYEPSNGCDMCSIKQNALKLDLGLSCTSARPLNAVSRRSREEVEANETFHDADWSELTESELEELVLSILDANFKSAIKKIVALGYSEEIATKAVTRSGLCYGCKDAVSNIVDNTLAFLRSGQNIGTMMHPCFENLQQKEKYMLAELVCVLKEVKPFYSTGDAMWRLLICDMNVSHACAMENEPMNSSFGDGIANGNSSTYNMPPLLKKEAKTADSNFLKPVQPNSSVSSAPTVVGVPNLKSKSSSVPCGLPTDNEGLNSKMFCLTGTTSLPVSEEKFVGSRRVSAIAKREYILRQKSLHLEKHRMYGSKGGSRYGKLSSFGGLAMDKKVKSVADSTAANAKNGFNLGKGTGTEMPPDNSNINLSTNICFSSVPAFKQEPDISISTSPKSNIQSSSHGMNTLPMLPPADTELSLSLTAKSSSDPFPVNFYSEAYNAVPLDKSLPQLVPHDKRDEIIQSLVSQVGESQNQLQQWTDWANQKVMEAACSLRKNKAEHKALQKEQEEFERLKKEKQTLEENTVKKLSEMENALCTVNSQVERANSTVCRLEVENATLRREMEAAYLHAADAAANCQEVSRREKTTLMNCRSWEKQKSILQEELPLAYKQLYAELQQELDHALDLRDKFEGRYALERRLKEEALTQANSLKKEKEQIEASAKCKEDTMKLKEESNVLMHKANLQKLENEILQLHLKTDSSKIAALSRGIGGSYASKLTLTLTDFSRTSAAAALARRYISRNLKTADIKEDYGSVKRERECVMCLTEEMSVVFLPCAHQVVCLKCNELHEKQGMRDCPSCRTLIQDRLPVRLLDIYVHVHTHTFMECLKRKEEK